MRRPSSFFFALAFPSPFSLPLSFYVGKDLLYAEEVREKHHCDDNVFAPNEIGFAAITQAMTVRVIDTLHHELLCERGLV